MSKERLQEIKTDKAPKALGPYSQAIKAGDFLYLSGQVGIDPESGKLVEGGIEAQVEQVLKNVKAILEEAGLSLNDVVKATCMLSDMNNFKAMNDIYAKYFGDHKPARVACQVGRLPIDALVEIEMIAYFS